MQWLENNILNNVLDKSGIELSVYLHMDSFHKWNKLYKMSALQNSEDMVWICI